MKTARTAAAALLVLIGAASHADDAVGRRAFLAKVPARSSGGASAQGAVSSTPAAAVQTQPAAEELDVGKLLQEMRRRGRSFDPAGLRKLGRGGLAAVLDRLLPETSGWINGVSTADCAELVRKLGAADYATREAATKKLIAVGRPHAGMVQKAAEHDDPEVRHRARAVLTQWTSDERIDVAPYTEALEVYLRGLDDEPCLLELADRLRVSLLQGAAAQQAKRHLLSRCLAVLTNSHQGKYCDVLNPVLGAKDESLAVWVVRCVGQSRDNECFPAFLLAALESDREAVVRTALNWTPNCWDRSMSGKVRRSLRRIFEGDNERLKFHACFSLMHGYRDPAAFDYLLSQVDSPDKARPRRALSWIGDACNSGRPASEKLIAKVVPLLGSKDKSLRRAAAEALGTYGGEAVVKNLIPLLADREAIIVSEVKRALLEQADGQMLRGLLRQAADTSANPDVRAKCTQMLNDMDSKAPGRPS